MQRGRSAMVQGHGSSGSDEPNRIKRIWVEGYDTSFDHHELRESLRRHFSSCGNVTHVYIPIVGGILNGFAFVYIQGEGALENALQLNGSQVNGWTLLAKYFPFRNSYLGHELEAMKAAYPLEEQTISNIVTLFVKGYDTTLPKADVDSAIRTYFSSCGDVKMVVIPGGPSRRRGGLNSLAHVLIFGEQAADKALKRSGRDVGGWSFLVHKVMPPNTQIGATNRGSGPAELVKQRILAYVSGAR